MPGEELLPRGLAASFGRQINAMSFEDIRDRAVLTASCAWACKGFSLICVRSMRGVAAPPAVLAFRDCGQLRASGELPGA
jgi:hypothetical protein